MKKKLLFIILLLTAGAVYSQNTCADLFISEYVEGFNNNKALELYNPTPQPIILDNQYRLIRWGNGSTISNEDPSYVLPLTDTIQPYGVMVIIQDTTKPGQDTMIWPALRKKGTWLAPYDYGGTTPGCNVAFWNGDDAISLQKKQAGNTWTDIDIFGEIGVRPMNWNGTYSPSGAWTDTKPYWRGTGIYLTKRTLKRHHQVTYGVNRLTMNHYGDSTTNGLPHSFYALLEYDSLPVNFFDSLGSHWCDCQLGVGVKPIEKPGLSGKITIYPNPSASLLMVEYSQTGDFNEALIEITDVNGIVVKSQPMVGVRSQIDISALFPGIYMAKVSMKGGVLVKRFARVGSD